MDWEANGILENYMKQVFELTQDELAKIVADHIAAKIGKDNLPLNIQFHVSVNTIKVRVEVV